MKDQKKNFTITLEVSVKAVDEKTAVDRLSIMLKRRGFDFKLSGKVTSTEVGAKPAKVKAIKPVVAKKEVKDAKKPVSVVKVRSIGMDDND